MIDLHTHILPEIDDGSSSLEESLDMAAMAARKGTHFLTATPHCNIPGLYDNYKSKYLAEVFRTLKNEIQRAEIPVKLVSGMEIYATPNLPDLFREKKIWTLNGQKYFLVEMSFEEDPDFLDYVLDPVVEMGYYPIIAHPERYYSVQDDPEIAGDWFRKGYGLQINKGSILGRFGHREERTAYYLLDHHLCTCIASDAHSAGIRTPNMADAYQQIAQIYGEQIAKVYFVENPKRILTGKPWLKMKKPL